MRKRHLQKLGTGRGGGSGRRTPGRWPRASLQRSRKKWQAGQKQDEEAGTRERFQSRPQTTSSTGKKCSEVEGRWFRDAGRPRTGPHEPPHVRREAGARERVHVLTSVPDLFLFSHCYLLELENPQWLLQMNCSLLHFLLADFCFSALPLVLSFWSMCPIGYTKKAILGDCLRTCTSSPRDNHLEPR